MPGRGARWRGALVTVAAAAVALTVLGALAFCACAGTAAASPGRAPGHTVGVAAVNLPQTELLAAL